MIFKKKIVFCFPYRGAGGVNMMFIRLATYFKKMGLNVAIVDYPDGAMATNNHSDVELIPYYDNKDVLIASDSIVILQTMTPWSIFPSLKLAPDSHVFFITTLPANLFPVIPGPLRSKMYEGQIVSKFFWYTLLHHEYKKVKEFARLLIDKKSIVLLDSDIKCNLKASLDLNFPDDEFLPLFSDDVQINRFYENYICSEKEELRLGWVGRLSDFKITILNHVIYEAFQYANKNMKKIIFHVVGDGELRSKLFVPNSKNFEVKVTPFINPEALDEAILDLDLLFAMGTSSLEGAKLGVPTVRLDYSYKEIPAHYKYVFLYEVKGYCLGARIGSCCFKNGIHSFSDVMGMIENEQQNVSRKCYSFYNENHSIKNSALMLLGHISKSSLEWRMIVDSGFLFSPSYKLKKIITSIFNKISH